MTQKLTFEEVREAALAAYHYGVLAAQAPRRDERACRYRLPCRDTLRVCAVGAAMMEYHREMEGNAFDTLVVEGKVAMPEEDDREAIQVLQFAHDNWLCAGLVGADFLPGSRDYDKALAAEREFLFHLGVENGEKPL